MVNYLTVNGYYTKGHVCLLGNLRKTVKEGSDVLILIPVKKEPGINIKEFLLKGKYCSLGGDALTDSQEIYND